MISKLYVANFHKAQEFIAAMQKHGMTFENYNDMDSAYSMGKHAAIWLAGNLDLQTSKLVIKTAKEIFPHIQYIFLADHGQLSDIFIGGSTERCLEIGLTPLSDQDFRHIESFDNKRELDKFIDSFRKQDQ